MYSINKFLVARAVFYACIFLPPILATASENSQFVDNPIDLIEAYFKNFDRLAETEKWEEIIYQGKTALEAARIAERSQDEAKICAQLTSTAFYLGDYPQAFVYASRSRELSEKFEDPAPFVRALYLESALYRANGAKNNQEQESYLRAVQIAEEALFICQTKSIDGNLRGKVYFNLGAAHADNPKGDLLKAEESYAKALECFKIAEATDDLIRTSIRLGKVYLLQKKYELSQRIIDEVRSRTMTERLAMHADYLEAQLKFAVHEIDQAIKIGRAGLSRARALGAKEDERRLVSFLQSIIEDFNLGVE